MTMIDRDAPLARVARWYATVALRCMGTGAVTMAYGWIRLDNALAILGAWILLAAAALTFASIAAIGWMEE